MIRDLLQMIFYPAVFLKRRLDKRPRGVGAILGLFVSFVFETVKWAVGVVILAAAAWLVYFRAGDYIGFVPQPLLIAGTGSMYPTFPKGEGLTPEARADEDVAAPRLYRYPGGIVINGTRYFGQQLKHGDIISFSNQKTTELILEDGGDTTRTTGFVKRVVALPGDTIEIRDGFVKLNGEIIPEPYTATARSTFGGVYMPDCAPIKVPEGKVVALGDNRKGSSDSRNSLGLIDITDIDRILPLEKQTEYSAGWHDTSNDTQTASKPVLEPQEYLDALNAIREEHDLNPLKYDKRLEVSARARANAMLQFDDLSFEATRSGLSPLRAMSNAGYSNIVWGEAPTLGYYTAEELLENYSQSESWKRFLLDETFDDTGIAAVVGNLNGCPVQIVVQHVAGYIPPEYKQSDIESWKNLRSNIESVLPSWERARTYGGQYEENKSDYERMISILQERVSIANTIISRMEANQWLSNADKQLIEQDKALSSESSALSNKLNNL